jgi:hypothetical protein
MIIGNTDEFAFEFSFAANYPKNMGFGRVWVKGYFIGTYLDLTYLSSYPFYVLDSINNAKDLREDLQQLSKDELFYVFEGNESEDFDKYRVTSTTFIDDFSIWCFRLHKKTHVLWKVINKDFFEDLKNYSDEVILKWVSPEAVEEVVEKYREELIELGIIR